MFNKDWAISYDRFVCLRDGYYTIYWSNGGQAGYETYLYKLYDGVTIKAIGGIKGGDGGGVAMPRSIYYDRGDTLYIQGGWDDTDYYNNFQIRRD